MCRLRVLLLVAVSLTGLPCRGFAQPRREGPYTIIYTPEGLKDATRDFEITHSFLLDGKKVDAGVIRMKGINTDNQAQGVGARITNRLVAISSRHAPRGQIRPPGWEDDRGCTRLMLFPYKLGGSGQLPQNLVTVYRATVVPKFSAVMDRIHDAAVKQGKTVTFSVTPIYRDKGKPASLVIKADIPIDGDKKEVTIKNDPPVKKEDLPAEKGLLPEVARLKRLMPPPAKPKAAGSDEGWKAAEKRWKLEFPEDYKQLIRLYGDGTINKFLYFGNPFSPKEHSRFEKETRGPPIPGGLLLVGRTINGDTVWWRTKGKPKDWTIVVWSRGFPDEYLECDCNLTTFLRRLFEEEIQTDFWGPDAVRPKFVPDEEDR